MAVKMEKGEVVKSPITGCMANAPGNPWLNCWTNCFGAYIGGCCVGGHPCEFATSAQRAAVSMFGLTNESFIGIIFKSWCCPHLTVMQIHRELEIRAAASKAASAGFAVTAAPGQVGAIAK